MPSAARKAVRPCAKDAAVIVLAEKAVLVWAAKVAATEAEASEAVSGAVAVAAASDNDTTETYKI